MTSVERLARVGGRAIDFDNHYYEPEDCFSRHIEPKYRELAIVPKGPEGARIWAMGDRHISIQPPGLSLDWAPAPGLAAGILAGDGDTGFAEYIFGDALVNMVDRPDWWDRETRIKVMDEQGLEAVLMIPSAGLL